MKLKRQNDIIDGIEEVQRALEKAWDELLNRKDPKPSCWSCTKPACCDQRTVAWFYEVLPLARHLKKSKLATPELIQQLKEVGDDMEETFPADWFDKRQPCVFLKDMKCSIYKYRPMTSCSSYWVVSDPELCDAENHTVVGQIDPTESWDHAMKVSQMAHSDLGLKQHTDRLLIAAFPRVLWIALTAWNKPQWVDYVHAQDWPNSKQLAPWLNGEQEQLVQVRKLL